MAQIDKLFLFMIPEIRFLNHLLNLYSVNN